MINEDLKNKLLMTISPMQLLEYVFWGMKRCGSELRIISYYMPQYYDINYIIINLFNHKDEVI